MANGDGTALLATAMSIPPAEALVERLRRFVRDVAAKNEIPWRDEEHSYKELEDALVMTLDDWNTTTPQSFDTYDSYPGIKLLMMGGAIFALRSAGLFHARNEFNYADGGIQVRIHDKTALYLNWLNDFERDYYATRDKLKIERNIASIGFGTTTSDSQGYGGIDSPYRDLG